MEITECINVNEWLTANFVKSDIEKLKRYGFTVEFEKAENRFINETKSEFVVKISNDKQAEILRTPYEIEKVVNIIEMYKGLNK